jgi:hypothetical protein
MDDIAIQKLIFKGIKAELSAEATRLAENTEADIKAVLFSYIKEMEGTKDLELKTATLVGIFLGVMEVLPMIDGLE